MIKLFPLIFTKKIQAKYQFMIWIYIIDNET